jgi:hypothetical protein
MTEFIHVHREMVGITADGLTEAHDADLAIQGEEGVAFKQAGRTLTVGSSTACPRPARPMPFNVFIRGPATLLKKSMSCR